MRARARRGSSTAQPTVRATTPRPSLSRSPSSSSFASRGERARWAARWRALGTHATFDADYKEALAALVNDFVVAENVAQLRVNDAMTAAGGVMLEFHRDFAATDPRERFVAARLRRTPSHAIDGHGDLEAFVTANRDDVLSDRFELPLSMATQRTVRGTAWELPGVEEPLRRAFAASTCDGCHGTEHPAIDSGFHVSPLRRGTAKLSRFLLDPEHRGEDELARRAAVLRRLACAG